MRQTNKIIKYFFLTVLMVLPVISFSGGIKYQQHAEYVSQKIKPSPTPIVIIKYPAPKSDLMSEWVKYEGKIDSDKKFSVEHPESWDVTREEGIQHIFDPFGKETTLFGINISALGSDAPQMSCVKKLYPSGSWNYCIEAQPRKWQNKEYRFRSALLNLNSSNVIIRAYFPEDYAEDYEKVLFKMLNSFQLLP